MSPLQRTIFTYELFINSDLLLNSDLVMPEDKQFEISPGESVEMICLRIEEEGIITSAELFRMFLIYFGLDRNIQSGAFTFNPQMSQVEIAKMITDPLARDISLTILPGWRIEEISYSLGLSGIKFSEKEFLDYAYNPTGIAINQVGVQNLNSLEGFLYPGRYVVGRDISLDQFINTVLNEFSVNVDSGLRQAFNNQGLSLIEAVTLASIIEKETMVDTEKPMIASVFYNRLSAGMKLETDPTVQYALGFDLKSNSWWKSPLYFDDLEIISEYNTYQIYGLPPGPISNPSLSSLRAVAYPAETAYYYFRAACDGSGSHNFAITFQEHLLNECP